VRTYDASPAALRPLVKMFWSARGWNDPAVPPAPAVFATAVAAGVMFDASRADDHDGWVAAARRAATALTPDAVGDGFLESLSRRRLDLRSALGSYGTARPLPEHAFRPRRDRMCAVCDQYATSDEDLNVYSFERFKWGGVRHHDITYAAFDLEQFPLAPRDGVTDDDRRLGRLVIDALRSLPAGAGVGRAVAAIRPVPGNNDERAILVEILRGCGIWTEKGVADDTVREYLPRLA
jgi:hypothetical protein